MDIWQMRYFIQVYHDKSFSKASRNLFISQQGISKTIKNIEEELHIELFDRTAKGVKPTIAGQLLYEQTRKIVKHYDQMIELFHNYNQQNQGTISIGMPNILYSDFFETICTFQEAYPEIKLNFVELGSFACEKYLSENLIEICFAIKPDNITDFEFIPVYKYNLVLLVNKQNPLSQKSTVKVIDLINEKFIMLSSEYKIRKLTMNRCLESGFNPNIIFTTSQMELIIEFVKLNKGIAIIPDIIH